MPAAVQESAAAVVGGKLYVMAGLDAAGHSTDGVYVFDGAQWGSGPKLPLVLDHPAAAATDSGQLFVGGGFSSGRTSARVFQLAGDHWQELAPIRHKRGAFALIAIGTQLFAIGGNDGNAQVAPSESYDLATQAWKDLPGLPAPRNHVGGFAYQGMACVAGGRSPNSVRVDCFNPATNAYMQLPDLPAATSGAGVSVLSDQVIVVGGEDAQRSFLVDQVQRFQSGSWRTESMMVPRHGAATAAFGTRVWVCGGAIKVGVGPTNVCTSIG